MSTDNVLAPPCNLVIFGAKGDLTRRKLLPALYQLDKCGYLPPEIKILGVGRADWDKKAYQEIAKEALKKFMKDSIDDAIWKQFSARLDFYTLDVNNTEAFNGLRDQLHCIYPSIFYLAMSSTTFGTICAGLANSGLNISQNRIVMEKPLGTDLKSSQEINNAVAHYFSEPQIYRIDHYLGKETVLNLLALRFANSLFASKWDRTAIDHVQITIAEEVGIEGRWGYFDQAGEMRDMVQNHLLQILAMIAMAPPATLNDDDIRNEKIKVLKALQPVDKNNVCKNAVRGQYTAGFIHGHQVPGYLYEEGANPQSNTETFVAIRAYIDNCRWAGVPFYLRAGKRLPTKTSEIVIYFKQPAINLFHNAYNELPQNKLTIRLQPNEGVDIEILNKVPGFENNHRLQTTKLNLNFNDAFQQPITDAYERLLLEVMRGKQALFVHRDEVEAAWKWIDSIINAWAAINDTPKLYQAGTWGPVSSVALITKDNRAWSEFK